MNKRKQYAFIMGLLRRGSLKWPARTQVLAEARTRRGWYTCAMCKEETHCKCIHVDHIDPVVPIKGWDSWDGVIKRMFCSPEGLQVLCKECHGKKTVAENKKR